MAAATAWAAAGLTLQEWRQHSLDIRIRIAAAMYMVGWAYSLSNPAVAFRSPGVPDNLVRRSRLTNCSTLTASILTAIFGWLPWSLQEYGDLQVFADRLPDHPDAPIRAVERMGVGARVSGPLDRRWHLVQGWRSLTRPSGHAFLVRRDGATLLVLEASSRNNVGPIYRRTTLSELADAYPAGLFWAVLPRV